jgi:homoserine kinase
MLHVKVPATSANLGPGFDCLGIAVQLYNEAWVEIADSISFEVEGEGAGIIPRDESNLFYVSFARFYKEIGKKSLKIAVKQLNRIPIERGLGGSAATIVGGLLAASKISGKVLESRQMLELATEIEGHPDNVAAALLGGLTVAYRQGERVYAVSFEPHMSLDALVLIPDYKLSTKRSRSVLPKKVTLSDAVFNLSRVSLLVGGIIEGKIGLLVEGTKDVLHQPYRTKLLPYFQDTMAILWDLGINTASLSGAGPSIFAFIEHGAEAAIKDRLNERLKEIGAPYSIMFLEFDTVGGWASTT